MCWWWFLVTFASAADSARASDVMFSFSGLPDNFDIVWLKKPTAAYRILMVALSVPLFHLIKLLLDSPEEYVCNIHWHFCLSFLLCSLSSFRTCPKNSSPITFAHRGLSENWTLSKLRMSFRNITVCYARLAVKNCATFTRYLPTRLKKNEIKMAESFCISAKSNFR